MKTVTNYIALVLSAALFGSCAGYNMNEAAHTGSTDSSVNEVMATDSVSAVGFTSGLLSSFESDSLSEEQVKGFTQRAKQKMEDFAGYLEVISNKRFGMELRGAALSQALSLFADSAAMMPFFNDVINSNYDSVRVENKPADIGSFAMDEGISYKGTVSMKVRTRAYMKGEPLTPVDHTFQGNFIIRKAEKTFGGATEKVWEVVLDQVK